MPSADSNALRRGFDGPIAIDLSDGDWEGEDTLLDRPSVATSRATDVESPSMLVIPNAPTGGAVWDNTMIHLKREAVHDATDDDGIQAVAHAVPTTPHSQPMPTRGPDELNLRDNHVPADNNNNNKTFDTVDTVRNDGSGNTHEQNQPIPEDKKNSFNPLWGIAMVLLVIGVAAVVAVVVVVTMKPDTTNTSVPAPIEPTPTPTPTPTSISPASPSINLTTTPTPTPTSVSSATPSINLTIEPTPASVVSATPTTRPTPLPTPDPTNPPSLPATTLQPSGSGSLPSSVTGAIVDSNATTFFVDYLARFRRVVDFGCQSPTAESVWVLCPAGRIEVNTTRTSGAIACAYESDGGTAKCLLNCTGTDCDDLYIDRDSSQLADNWARIYFRCSGENVNAVDTFYEIEDSSVTGITGSCEAGVGTRVNRLHGQLHVSCPNEDTGNVEYANSHAYAECSVAETLLVNGREYTCSSGQVCGSDACVVEYTKLQIQADHQRFQQCIRTIPENVTVPLPEVYIADNALKSEGQYSAQFQLETQVLYNETVCEAIGPGIRVVCVDGTIELISAAIGMDCGIVTSNEIECFPNGLVPKAYKLEYNCTAQNVVPATQVEFLSTDIMCSLTQLTQQVATSVSLRVSCTSDGNQNYYPFDFYFECSDDNKYMQFGNTLDFTCYSIVDVPSGNSVVTIPPSIAFTDHRWAYESLPACYSYTAPTLT